MEQEVTGEINIAAATRLEFKMVAAMIDLNKQEALKECQQEERRLSSQFKIRAVDWVHPAVMKQRNAITK